MDSLLQDLRYAVRTLAKSPGFTAIAVLTLALGIGAATTVFSVVERLLLHPLPFSHSDRLVSIWLRDPVNGGLSAPRTPFITRWREASSLDSLATMTPDSWYLEGAGDPQIVNGVGISPNLLALAEVSPILGRPIVPRDTLPGAPDVVLLGERLWRTTFGARTDLLGMTIRLDTLPYTIVGVVPERLDAVMGWRPIDVWTPPLRRFHPQFSFVAARLHPGVSATIARRELTALDAAVEPEPGLAAFERRVRVELERPGTVVAGDERQALVLLSAAVSLLLLVACANVANLLLARSTRRAREMAVRKALGAGRRRLVAQLMSESLVLALGGAAAGLAIVAWSLSALRSFHPARIYPLAHLSVDARVLWFSAAVAVGVTLLVGLLPAFRASDVDLQDALKSAGPGAGSPATRLHAFLVGAELALSTALLFTGGLLYRSLVAALHADPGFEARGLVAAQVAAPPCYWCISGAAVERFWDGALARIRRDPRYTGAVLTWHPIPDAVANMGLDCCEVPGAAEPAPETPGSMSIDDTPPGYFATFGIPILEGRAFTPDEHRTGAPVAVINQTMARRFWPGTSAVGGQFRWTPRQPWYTVVGVVRDHPVIGGPADVSVPYEIRTPVPERSGAFEGGGWLVARVAAGADPNALLPDLRAMLRSENPGIVVAAVTTVPALLADRLANSRFTTTLLAAFAVLTLAIAAVGLFGVLSYTVARRTREIGIRMALGARAESVVSLVVRQGLVATAVGLGVGVLLGLVAARLFASLLYHTPPADVVTMVGVTVVLAMAAVAASWVPARRATRVNPVDALRAE